MSAAPLDTGAVTISPYGADGTVRADGFTQVLAEGDKQIVQDEPVAPGQLGSQCHFRFVRSLCRDIPQTIRYSMHVDVDCDPRLAECQGDDDVRGLAPHAGQAEQIVKAVGHPAFEPLQKLGRYFTDRPRLHPVERNRIDVLLNVGGWNLDQGFGRRGNFEQSFAGGSGRLILRTEAQDARDEDRKW